MKRELFNNYSIRREKKQSSILLHFMFYLSCFLALSACKDDKVSIEQYDPSKPVTVSNIEPVTGGITTPIVIEGNNFGTDKEKVKVFFDDREAVVINVVNNYIYALVPKCPGGETQVKVVVDDNNSGILENKTFNYVVSARVTTVASDFATEFNDMLAIATDDEENLVICENYDVLLYSGEDNKMVTIQKNLYRWADVHFSADYKDLYLMPYDPMDALLVILHKEQNWSKEIIFASDDLTSDMYYSYSMTVDEEGTIYIYGVGDMGGVLYKVDPTTRQVTRMGDIPEDNGYSLTYNPADQYLYLSLGSSQRIIRVPSRKTNITNADVETVIGGSNQIIQKGEIENVYGIEFDSENNLYAAGTANNEADHVIYKIDMANKEASILAGKGQNDMGVDGDIQDARFYFPMELCINPEDIIYIMEYYESRWDFVPGVARLRCLAIQ